MDRPLSMNGEVARPLRIVFLHGSLDMYGSDRALLVVVKALNARGHKIRVIVPDGYGPLLAALAAESVEYRQLPSLVVHRGIGLRKVAWIAVSAAMARKRYHHAVLGADVVHVNLSTVLTPLVVRTRAPIAWHVREWLPATGGERAIARSIAGVARVVFAPSEGTAVAFRRAAAPFHRRVVVVPDALERSIPDDCQPPAAEGPPVILCVGRLMTRKGQDILLRAIEHLDAGSVQVWLAGGPPPEQSHFDAELRHAAMALRGTQVDFLGEVASGEALMRRADVVVAPSVKPESFGLVVLEAFRAGVPIVASDVDGYSELIESGVNGMLFPAGDDAALASCLMRLLGDTALRDRIVAGGRKTLHSYTVDRTVALLEGAYGRLVTDGAR